MKWNDPKFISACVATCIAIILIVLTMYDPHVDQQTKLSHVQTIGQMVLAVWMAVIGGVALHQYGETKADPGSSSNLQAKLEKMFELVSTHPEMFQNLSSRLSAIENQLLPQPSILRKPDQTTADATITTLQSIPNLTNQPTIIMPNKPPGKFPPEFHIPPNTFAKG